MEERTVALLTTRGSRQSASKNFALWPLKRFNHNVVVIWIGIIFEMAGDSIWNGMVLAAFVYELMGSTVGKGRANTYVGYVEAAQGVINLVVAFPVGYCADRYSKSKIIYAGALTVPIAGAAMAFAAVYGTSHESHALTSYYILFAAGCMWGVSYAVYGGPAQALFADSTPNRGRAWY
jgi:MFS family permease